MDYEIFSRTTKFCINQIHCMTELPLINKDTAICQPELIVSHFTTDIDNCTTNSNFNFLNFVEDKQTKFLIEAIKHHHLIK